jgi:hypothetical protein
MFDFLKPKEGGKESGMKSREPEEDNFSDDPVDKIFGFFFGKKEETPMGMKRFGRGASTANWKMHGTKTVVTHLIDIHNGNREVPRAISSNGG